MRVGIDFRGAQSGGSSQRGIGRYTIEMLKGILDYAPDIQLVLFAQHDAEIPSQLREKCEVVPVVAPSWSDAKKPLWLKIPKIRSIKRFHEMRFRAAERKQRIAMERVVRSANIDVLHIPSALDVGSYPIYSYPCPVVMTFLDAIVVKLKEINFDRYPWFLQTYYYEQVENLKRADAIVAISEASASDAVELFKLDRSKVSTVYPAVSNDYAVPTNRPVIAGNQPYFLFCSVPDPHKNPDVVLKAFAQMPSEMRLIMVSPKDSAHVPPLIELSNSLGVGDRITWTGYVSEDELIGLFQHAVALVSPSQMEGFGLPVGQAMRAGVPVITSKYSAQGEIAKNCGLLIDPNSVDELAASMRLALEGNVPEEKIEAGRRDAHQFDADIVTLQLISVYRAVLQKS